jgi:ribosomal protein S12 methylthiotransferase
MDSFAFAPSYWFPNGCVRNYDASLKYVIIYIPLQHISDSILKSMRRGTTQAKTTKLLKEFRAAVPWYSNYFNRISGDSGRFQYLERFCSRNEIDRMGCFAYSRRIPTY